MSLTQQEKDQLFDQNIQEINKMAVAAGSMVKGLIQELDRKNRDTYIKLKDAEPDGHVVFYDFVAGDPDLIRRVGIALGFKTYTESKLEVRHG
jgi:hypothetical protein